MGSPKAPSWENFPEDEVNILMAHNLDVLTARWPDLFNLVLTGHVHAGEFGIGKFINGSSFLKLIGDYKDLNQHLVGWNALTERCLSYVSPGFSRHFGNFGVKPPGGTLITLRSE
jgi:predicted MPP superfamily phosphohydrolase